MEDNIDKVDRVRMTPQDVFYFSDADVSCICSTIALQLTYVTSSAVFHHWTILIKENYKNGSGLRHLIDCVS